MVVKWSECLPSTPTIPVRIPLKVSVLFYKLVEKRENNSLPKSKLAELKKA